MHPEAVSSRPSSQITATCGPCSTISDRIGLFGGIDLNTLCRNTDEDLCREVLEKGTRYRNRARGYGLGSGNSIPEYVPVEGFMAMIDAAREIRARP